MKNKVFFILLGILIFLSGITIAYKEEIKQFSENAIQNYIIEQIQTMSQEKQEDFKVFSELKIENKFQKAWELNKIDNKDEEN